MITFGSIYDVNQALVWLAGSVYGRTWAQFFHFFPGSSSTFRNHQNLLPVTALLGGLLVTLADLVSRTFFAPIELPCSVVTAAIGAPFFLYLLIRNRSK